MHWFDIDDGNGELGVLEVGDYLELLAIDAGDVVLWAWLNPDGELVKVPEVGQA